MVLAEPPDGPVGVFGESGERGLVVRHELKRRFVSTAEILEGLEGDALAEMRAANEINLRMAPLTPDHHFYIDQGANAHVRQVLLAIGRKLVAAGVLDAPDDVVYFRYNELRVFMGNPAGMDGRAIVAKAKAAREKAYTFRPKE